MSKDWTEQTAIQLLEEENAQLRSFNKELLYDNEQKYVEMERLMCRIKQLEEALRDYGSEDK